MAITLVGSNLNTWGDTGRFEADPSTWLGASPMWESPFFPGTVAPMLGRSATYAAAGTYSAKLSLAGGANQEPDPDVICYGKPVASFLPDKKYLARVKVRTDHATPIAPDNMKVVWKKSNFSGGTVFSSESSAFVGDIKDGFVELELRFTNSNGQPIIPIEFDKNGEEYFGIFTPQAIWIDSFEIYEYIDSDDPGPGPDPEPEFDSVFHSKNPIVFQHSAAAGWEAIDNYRLYADVQVENDDAPGVYRSLLKLKLYPDSAGKVYFHMRQAFPGSFLFFPPNQNTIVRLTDRIKRWKYYFGEMQGDDVEPAILNVSSSLLVLYGGIAKAEYPGLNFFTSYLPEHKKFLTWAPAKKTVDRLQEDYLNYWVFSESTVALNLRIKAYFDDGSDQTATTKTITGVQLGELYQLPAGPVNSGATAVNVAKNLLKYDLWLIDQDDAVISEVRTYMVAQVRHPLTRFIMFLNSLGAYETIRFVGQAEASSTIDREIVSVFLPHDYQAWDSEFAVHRAVIQESRSLSTGYLKDQYAAEWFEYLKDLMISPRIFDVTGGQRKRIVFNDTSMPGRTDQDYLMFARFQALDPFKDDSYTPPITPPAV